ncbi:hypothetical protein [Candidatus Desulforudis audaxviator]|nr:hypothetical protein [Candidatus Desulforudis audaxviator]
MMAVILKIPSSFPEWDANDQAVYDKLLVIGEPFAFCTTPLNMLNRGQKNIIKESFRGRILFIGEKKFPVLSLSGNERWPFEFTGQRYFSGSLIIFFSQELAVRDILMVETLLHEDTGKWLDSMPSVGAIMQKVYDSGEGYDYTEIACRELYRDCLS